MDNGTHQAECKKHLAAYLEAVAKRPTSNIDMIVNGLYAYTPGQHLPDNLTETLASVYAKYGTSGDVFCDTARLWMRAGANRVMTADELFPVSTP